MGVDRSLSGSRTLGGGGRLKRFDQLFDDFGEFASRVEGRLAVGAEEYGNSAERRPPTELADELAEEALDIAGWGFLLYRRIQRLRRRVAELEAASQSQREIIEYIYE